MMRANLSANLGVDLTEVEQALSLRQDILDPLGFKRVAMITNKEVFAHSENFCTVITYGESWLAT